MNAFTFSVPQDVIVGSGSAEKLGEAASHGLGSSLYVVEVPDDVKWTITDYDGVEQVEEVHRVWS